MINFIIMIGRHKFYPFLCLFLVTLAYLYTDPFDEISQNYLISFYQSFEFRYLIDFFSSLNQRYLISFFGAISGLICVILLAKRKNSGNVFGIIAAFGESTANILGGNIGASLPSFYYLGSHVFALFSWNKNKDDEQRVKVRTLNVIHFLFMFIFLIFAFYLNVYLTSAVGVDNSTVQLIINSIIFGLGITAQLLLMLRFSFNWYLWVLLNILVIGLNIYTDNIIIATQYLIYLFNAVYGICEWKYKTKVD